MQLLLLVERLNIRSTEHLIGGLILVVEIYVFTTLYCNRSDWSDSLTIADNLVVVFFCRLAVETDLDIAVRGIQFETDSRSMFR